MKPSKFTESQIAFILCQAEEGAAVEDGLQEGGRFPADVISMA